MGEIGYFFGAYARRDEYRTEKPLRDAVLQQFLQTYDPAADAQAWFANVKAIAASLGFAAEMRDYKADPAAYRGSVSDVAEILRIAVTGRANSPDLYTIMQIVGADAVKERICSAMTREEV